MLHSWRISCWFARWRTDQAGNGRIQIGLQAPALLGAHAQSQLGTTPQNVLAVADPLVANEVVNFPLVKLRAKVQAEVFQTGGVAQQDSRASAVVTEPAVRQCRRQPRPAL